MHHIARPHRGSPALAVHPVQRQIFSAEELGLPAGERLTLKAVADPAMPGNFLDHCPPPLDTPIGAIPGTIAAVTYGRSSGIVTMPPSLPPDPTPERFLLLMGAATMAQNACLQRSQPLPLAVVTTEAAKASAAAPRLEIRSDEDGLHVRTSNPPKPSDFQPEEFIIAAYGQSLTLQYPS